MTVQFDEVSPRRGWMAWDGVLDSRRRRYQDRRGQRWPIREKGSWTLFCPRQPIDPTVRQLGSPADRKAGTGIGGRWDRTEDDGSRDRGRAQCTGGGGSNVNEARAAGIAAVLHALVAEGR